MYIHLSHFNARYTNTCRFDPVDPMTGRLECLVSTGKSRRLYEGDLYRFFIVDFRIWVFITLCNAFLISLFLNVSRS
jgi:hypothetical protein